MLKANTLCATVNCWRKKNSISGYCFAKAPTSYRKIALISVIFFERFGLVEDFQSSEENNFGEPCIHYPSRVTVSANIIKWTHILLVILSDKPIHCLSFSLMAPWCFSFYLMVPCCFSFSLMVPCCFSFSLIVPSCLSFSLTGPCCLSFSLTGPYIACHSS